jgi:hypothetical protein
MPVWGVTGVPGVTSVCSAHSTSNIEPLRQRKPPDAVSTKPGSSTLGNLGPEKVGALIPGRMALNRVDGLNPLG